jgi:flagellar biosynthesis chaperone FliJ
MAIESSRHHFDENKRAAAEHLNPLLSQYGNLAAKPYNEETAGIYNFLQELRETYADDVQTLELREWLDELERNNQEFEQAVLERNRENSGKTDLDLMDIRRQTNRCYLDIVERLEALMLIEGDNNYSVFAKTLNTNIERYKNALAQRRGRNKIKN